MQLKLVGETVIDADEKPCFEAFWLLQVKKVKRFEAQRLWNKLTPDEQLQAMVGWVAQRPHQLEKEWEFRVHPSTWLYQKRWDDELPPEAQVVLAAAHKPAGVSNPGERTAMPENVRALIAKMRKS